MNHTLRNLTAAATVAALMSTTVWAATPSAGYVDFGKFSADVGEQFVEVDVNAALLKLAAAFAKHEDPAIAELLNRLERVRVNVFGLNDQNRSATLDRINVVRAGLDQQGWVRVVTVREKKGDDVAVFIKQATEDSIHGVVVTVLGADGQAVLVNIVGDVPLEQIAKLGESLNIEPLRKLVLNHPVES